MQLFRLQEPALIKYLRVILGVLGLAAFAIALYALIFGAVLAFVSDSYARSYSASLSNSSNITLNLLLGSFLLFVAVKPSWFRLAVRVALNNIITPYAYILFFCTCGKGAYFMLEAFIHHLGPYHGLRNTWDWLYGWRLVPFGLMLLIAVYEEYKMRQTPRGRVVLVREHPSLDTLNPDDGTGPHYAVLRLEYPQDDGLEPESLIVGPFFSREYMQKYGREFMTWLSIHNMSGFDPKTRRILRKEPIRADFDAKPKLPEDVGLPERLATMEELRKYVSSYTSNE